MSKKASQEERDFFIAHTLPYEVWMMRETHHLLREEKHPPPIRNALIESFCIHARNLIEFFKAADCDFDPRRFAKDGSQLQKRFVGDAVLSRIARQIAHISRDRITLVHDKIDREEQDKIKADIEAELARLQQNLTEEYSAKWRVPAPELSRRYYGFPPDTLASTTSAPMMIISWGDEQGPAGVGR
jgi:hypothetical protein